MEVRTRFAPSPTGFLHIGGARTALFNWLFARGKGGAFILRIEDTDLERSTEDSTDEILRSMEWLGLNWDEGPYFQSRRLPLYREYAEKLAASNRAYRCFCTKEELDAERERLRAEGKKPAYGRRCLGDPPPGRDAYALRFLSIDRGETVVDDLIKGAVPFSNAELEDLVILRSDGMPTYNFTVVVDDALMGITHVLRGDDHLNNTPKQIQIYEALGFSPPLFGHLPMILGPDRTRLSKRHGAMSVMEYRDRGFLPEGLVNALARLGWSHGDQELFSVDELLNTFSLDHVGKAPGVFNEEKLLWVNHQHVKTSPPPRIAEAALPFFRALGLDPSGHPRYEYAVKTLMERSKTLVELAESGAFYFQEEVEMEEKGRSKFLKPELSEPLTLLASLLRDLDPFDEGGIERCFGEVTSRFSMKLGKIAQPIRVALTGKTVSPGIYEVIYVLGKTETLTRLNKAIEALGIDS